MSLKSRFCAKCGKAGKSVGSLCADCFLEIHPIRIPKKISIRYCTKCGSVWSEGIWIKPSKSIDEYLLRKIIDKIKIPEEIKLLEANIIKKGVNGELKITLKFGDSRLVERYDIQLITEKFCCPACSREKSSTHLAKLQLRTDKNVKKFVEDASKIAKKIGKYVVKAEEQKQGIDLYISTKDAAMSLANSVKKKLNCRMKMSTKQHGWDRMRNKPLTKLTILLRER
jgi:nonsense-mediated mRNA decay protein 3